MTDSTAFYEPVEDELLSSLAVPQYGGEQNYDDESYGRMQELDQHAYAQQIAAAEQEQAQALEQVPEDVKRVRLTSWEHGIANLSSLFSFTRRSWRTTSQRSPTCTRAAGTNSLRFVIDV